MYHHLILHIQSIFTQFRFKYLFVLSVVNIGFIPLVLDANQTDWVLSGTFISDTKSHAMFVNMHGSETVLTLGEKLNGCELVNVLHGSAELNCGEKLHTLYLRNSIGGAIYPEVEKNHVARQYLISLSKESVLNYINERQRLISEISLVPFVNDKEVIGFQISKIQPFSKVAALGLHNGDVVTTINGVSAKQPSQFLQAVRELRTASEATIVVDRFGQKVSYRYILN